MKKSLRKALRSSVQVENELENLSIQDNLNSKFQVDLFVYIDYIVLYMVISGLQS